jgi:hypothetical protein
VVYVIQVCRQLSTRTAVPSCSCSKAVYKPVWHIPLLSVQWINSWWWTDELSETCRISCLNKFVKLVHLVGFIINKFVTMHGHTNVKTIYIKFAFRVSCKLILQLPAQDQKYSCEFIVSKVVKQGSIRTVSHFLFNLWWSSHTPSAKCARMEQHTDIQPFHALLTVFQLICQLLLICKSEESSVSGIQYCLVSFGKWQLRLLGNGMMVNANSRIYKYR